VLIAAHRDTHFRFLGDLQPGHRIELEQPAGIIRNWRVNDRRVVDSRETQIDLGAPGPLLTLVTCYPLDAPDAGGPLRLVVSAIPAEGEKS
jgi:sortase A